MEPFCLELDISYFQLGRLIFTDNAITRMHQHGLYRFQVLEGITAGLAGTIFDSRHTSEAAPAAREICGERCFSDDDEGQGSEDRELLETEHCPLQ